MANTTLKTRLVVRHDTKENWELRNPILLNGEMGIELGSSGKNHKIKFGDGIKTWTELEYTYDLSAILALIDEKLSTVGSKMQVYEASVENGGDKIAALQLIATEPEQGDIGIVSEDIAGGAEKQLTAYVYNGTEWKALDGNYNADNVYFDKDLTITANIGVQTIDTSGSKTLSTKGKNVQQVFDMIVAQEKNPSITQPSASISLSGAGAKEVGTEFTPSFNASLKPGSYQYGPATGVVATTYAISDTNSNSAETASGSFEKFTVTDNTNYKVNVTISYGDGAIPVTNLGNEYAAGQIRGGNKTASSSTVTGYRSWFNYVGTNVESVDGTWIRTNCTNKNASGYASFSLSIPAGTKRVVVAIPASKNQTLKSVIDVDGMGLDVKGNFVQSTAQVEGLNAYAAAEYDVWVFTNTNGVSKTTYNFTFGA